MYGDVAGDINKPTLVALVVPPTKLPVIIILLLFPPNPNPALFVTFAVLPVQFPIKVTVLLVGVLPL